MHKELRVRRSLTDLQTDYENGHKEPLETLMRAWRGIKALPPSDPNSFFVIGGYHGEPFRGAGWGNSSFWGGYCNHGNVLFPTWHRAYLMRLEDALRSIKGCEGVALPYWDETSEESRTQGMPWALTKEKFELDGESIDNPLRSFVLPAAITDFISGDDPNYSKPKGYETVRYPLSGLVGSDADRKATKEHNDQYPDYSKNVGYLNQNLVNWLGLAIIIDGKPVETGVARKYRRCLDAPNYTVFSNTTSMSQWNADHGDQAPVVALESPHNSMHLAVGGYDVASGPNAADFSPISGANGDMGENDTAALDPVFFFHHCFVDRVFWLWQVKNGATNALEIIDQYPGTNSVDSQGPTPGVTPNSWLTLDSPLDPFKLKSEGGRPVTSRDCVNIETQLGYTYGPGSLQKEASPVVAAAAVAEPAPKGPANTVQISGINRAPIRGSFVVNLYANVNGERKLIDTEAVLSRWHVAGCANCQTHLEVKTFTGLHDFEGLDLSTCSFEAEIQTRDGKLSLSDAGELLASAGKVAKSARRLFKLEVR